MSKLERPVPFEEWPDYFKPMDLVKYTGGLIGRPTAYKIAEEIGFLLGSRNRGIDKITFLAWLMGEKNEYVLTLKNREAGWTTDEDIKKMTKGGKE